MKKVNTSSIEWKPRVSPSKRFARAGKKISEALGRDPDATDLDRRHPFDVEITTIPAGAASCPYHAHSAQWEFYHVISGSGTVRDAEGMTHVEVGDAFIFKPNEPYQIINDSAADLTFYVIADNPIGESCHYPDSGKWAMRAPQYVILRGEPADYYDGEE